MDDFWAPILIGGLCVALPLVFIMPVVLRGLRHRRLRRHGVTARATVVRLMRGASADDQMVFDITVMIAPADRPPFEATVTQQYSVLDAPMLQPGQLVMVKYDRAKPSDVVVVGFGHVGIESGQ